MISLYFASAGSWKHFKEPGPFPTPKTRQRNRSHFRAWGVCISNLFQSKCYLTTWQDSGDNRQGCRIAVVTDSIFVRAQQNQERGIVDSEAKTWVSGSKQPDEHGTSRHTVNTTYGEPRDFLSSLTCGNTEGSIQQLPEMSG